MLLFSISFAYSLSLSLCHFHWTQFSKGNRKFHLVHFHLVMRKYKLKPRNYVCVCEWSSKRSEWVDKRYIKISIQKKIVYYPLCSASKSTSCARTFACECVCICMFACLFFSLCVCIRLKILLCTDSPLPIEWKHFGTIRDTGIELWGVRIVFAKLFQIFVTF